MSGSDAWLALASGLCCAVAGALFAQRVRRLRPDVDLRSVLRATAAPWVAFGCMVAATGAGLAFEVDRDLAWRLPDLVELHFLAFAGAAAFGPAGFLFGFTVHLSFVVGHRRRWPLAAGALGTFLAAGLAWAVATRPIAPDLGSDVTPEGYVLQTSGESCAAASAANVARQLGFATTEREMAERLGTTKLGTSPAQVIAGLAELGVVCQRINREDPDPSKVAQPAVLFVDHRETGPESHAVAFLGMARGRALVVDPLYGLHPMTPAKLRALARPRPGVSSPVMDRAPSLLVRCAPLCALLVAPASVSANFRPGAFGEPAGEPLESDWFRNIHVLHEDLHFDLRPLEDDGFPVVEVRYRIRNDGPALDAPLEFISPGIRRSSVLVDGCVVPADAMGDPRHLDEWHMEVDVPTIGGGTHPYSYILGGTRRGDPDGESIRFVASMEHGEHDLLVRYDVRPMSHAGWRMAEQFDVAYLLAPARAWASFGELDVTVLLPEEWEFASTLPLARKGDEARGTFDGLPADALAVAAVRPTPMWVEVLAWVPHVLAALFFRWWMRRARTAGRLEGRLRVPSALGWGAWVVGAVSAAFLVVGFCLSAFLMSLGRSLWFALHAYGWWAIVPVGLVAVPIAGLCGWVTGRGEALPPARYGSLSSE